MLNYLKTIAIIFLYCIVRGNSFKNPNTGRNLKL